MLRLRDQALIMAAPPCSLYGPACSSVHKRTADRPEGDQRVFKVRLAHRIWANMVAWIGCDVETSGFRMF